MCNCLSFLLENPTLTQKWVDWEHSLSLFCRRFQSWSQSFQQSPEVELFHAITSEGCLPDASQVVLSQKHVSAARGDGCSDGFLEKCGIHVIRRRKKNIRETNASIGYSHDKGHKGGTTCSPNAEDVDQANAMHYQESQGKEQNDVQAFLNQYTHAVDQANAMHYQESQGKEQNDVQAFLNQYTHAAESMKQVDATNLPNKSSSQAIDIANRDGPKNAGAPFQDHLLGTSPRTVMSGGGGAFSLFTQQGLKGTNQDSMIVWENFLSSENVTFCGVFDGHGPHGHHISQNVRDKLPGKLASCWQAVQLSSLLAHKSDSLEKSVGSIGSRGSRGGDSDHIALWEETFHSAFKLMDRELLVDEDVDCVFSGTTAVTLVKQGNDLIIANVGDSRAVLGVKFEDSLIALQLTVDLTPNLPKEAERIRRCKGRVLALRKEPFVKRVWLPHENTPGLAMARAFGDYILKNFGVISVPEVTHRRVSKNDKFVVLATDGVWDVLSNEQVLRIVDAAPVRSLAAQAVVDTAVHAWKVKYPDAKVDDCAVVCLFLDYTPPESWQATNSPW